MVGVVSDELCVGLYMRCLCSVEPHPLPPDNVLLQFCSLHHRENDGSSANVEIVSRTRTSSVAFHKRSTSDFRQDV